MGSDVTPDDLEPGVLVLVPASEVYNDSSDGTLLPGVIYTTDDVPNSDRERGVIPLTSDTSTASENVVRIDTDDLAYGELHSDSWAKLDDAGVVYVSEMAAVIGRVDDDTLVRFTNGYREMMFDGFDDEDDDRNDDGEE